MQIIVVVVVVGGGGGGGGDGGGGGGGVAPSLIPQFSVLVFFGEGCSPSLTIPHHPSSLSFLVFLVLKYPFLTTSDLKLKKNFEY